MKLTISKSKNSVHFYVQKSIRVNKNKTSTITIEKLGSLEEVITKAGGKDPYVWAQEYVNELSRREYEEQKEILIPYHPARLIDRDMQHAYNCGYLFLQKCYYRLGLDKICSKISSGHAYEYDLNDILSKLIYTRILYPASKQMSCEKAKLFLEQPGFSLKDVYRSLSVLAEENDFIQAQLYRNSSDFIDRNDGVIYYDCTNYFFEIEEEDDLRKYGKSKQHQPLPIVGMGLFMDYDGMPLAFDIFPGNKNEQPTLKPLEKKLINDFGLNRIVVCTDAGLSSIANRKFNDKKIKGEKVRGFITTQSIKQLPEQLKEYALDTDGWHLPGSNKLYNLNDITEEDYKKVFYKDRWITEDLSKKKRRSGVVPLEQHLIISFSLKYKRYEERIREGQINRAQKLIETGRYKRNKKNANDPVRFIREDAVTADGEICSERMSYIDEALIAEEARYDGFYAVCTNLDDMSVEDIVQVNKKRWQIEESFKIMKTEFRSRPAYVRTEDHILGHFITCFIALYVYRLLERELGYQYTCEQLIDTLRSMILQSPGKKLGYIPAYTRSDITDSLHRMAGFRTDYEIMTEVKMKQIIRNSKGKK